LKHFWKSIEKKALLRDYCEEDKEKGLCKVFLSLIVKEFFCTRGNRVRLMRISLRIEVVPRGLP
jgi:hypothetical protein